MNPKVREILYVIGVVVFAALSLLSTFRVIDPNTAATVSAALTSVLGLFGVTGFGVAAYNVRKQQQDGSFDPTPELTPGEHITTGFEGLARQRNDLESAMHEVTSMVSRTAAENPVLGPLAQQILNQIVE